MKLPKLSSEITLFDNVGMVDKLTFTKHLSLMLKSGIALAEAISILQKQTRSSIFKKILFQIHKDIANGQPLNKALAKFPKVFNVFYVNLIKVAEESGTLENTLNYLAVHLKKQHDFSNKIKGALLYPSIILVLAFITGFGLSIFVLPKLIDLFNSLDVELPLSTKILLFTAGIMKDYGIYIFVGLILFYIIFRILIATKYLKPRWHRFLLSIPVLGNLLQEIELASIFRNLGTMLSVGVPIAVVLDTQHETTNNLVYKDYLIQIKEGVKKGKSIAEILSATDKRFMPLIATRMIGVGETTGKLDETLSYLGDFFEDEVDNATKNLTTVLEPSILIIVGLIVGFIAIAIIGPIYQFTGTIQR